jgi:FkbH-like protein
MIYDRVKLVIWDLDDTFWSGTLSEGSIKISDENIHILNTLTSRGIINSISSKNDYDIVKETLNSLGIWDRFVFPMINWNPKGQQVKIIIENCQLRPENVLFIDDNVTNIEEVKYYNHSIQVAFPNEIPSLLDNPFMQGSIDLELEKLKQYKILEEKAKYRETCVDNDSFLSSCNIKVEIINNVEDYHDRIYELLNKTNQLNFTKLRIPLSEVRNEFQSGRYEDVGLVKVTDRFGDYGIIGVYALRNNRLEHFAFSCRILNLGIEQFIYNMLGNPVISINGEVSSNLMDDSKNKYIELVNNSLKKVKITNDKNDMNISKKSLVLMRGGCDLEQIAHYLDNSNVICKNEFNYIKNGIDYRRESLFVLYQSQTLNSIEKDFLINNLYFYDKKMFNTNVFNYKNYVLILSFLTEYSRGVYQAKHNDRLKILYGNYDIDITKEKNWDYLLSKNYYDNKITLPFLKMFKEKFEYKGPVDILDFKKYLSWLLERVEAKRIVFITGSEFNFEKKIGNIIDQEKNRYLHHIEFNNVLRDYVNKYKSISIVNVDNYIKGKFDFNDNIRHYNRKVYYNMANDIVSILNKKRNNKTEHNLKSVNSIIKKIKIDQNSFRNIMMNIDYWMSDNPKLLKQFRGKHRNERCFIIGNGPSLTVEDLEKLGNEVTFASNRIFYIFPQTEWRPTYYMCHDFMLLKSIYKDVQRVESQASFFPINMKWLFDIDIKKGIKFLHKTDEFCPAPPKFSNDISKGIYEGATVTYAAIQLAAYMGFKEIYLLGVDFSYSKCIDVDGKPFRNHNIDNYFVSGKASKNINLPNLQKSYLAYKSARHYAKINNIKIYNATRGGNLDIFPRINIDDLFK